MNKVLSLIAVILAVLLIGFEITISFTILDIKKTEQYVAQMELNNAKEHSEYIQKQKELLELQLKNEKSKEHIFDILSK